MTAEVAELGTPEKVRRGDILARDVLSKWQSPDLIEANHAAYEIGLLVSASLLGQRAALGKLSRRRTELGSEVSWSQIMDAFRIGQMAVVSAGYVAKRLSRGWKPANDNQQRFTVTWFKDAEEVSPKSWVIDDFIAVGEFDATVGKPGSGKSVIVTDAGCHVASGRPWNGRPVEQSLVVYFAAERRALTLRRVAAFKKFHGVDDDIPFAVVGGKLDLTAGTTDARALVGLVRQLEQERGYPCRWIVIDTLSRTFGGGDQNASKDMARFVQSIDEIMSATQAHVTVIHHSPWTEKRGKGAVDLDGAIDASFFVSKSGKAAYSLECDGANDAVEGPIVKFTLKSVEIGVDLKGNAISAPVVVPRAGNVAGLYPLEAKPPIKGEAAAALECLESLIASGGVHAPAGTPGVPAERSVVRIDDWKGAYCKGSTAKPDSAARTFTRVVCALAEGEHIAKSPSGIWVWLTGQPTATDKPGQMS